MARPNVAIGFLYHAPSGKILLHLRGTDVLASPGRWAFFGGRAEPEDGGDLLVTWCREMREELGVTLDPARAVFLQHGTDDDGMHWHEYFYAWPSLNESFVLTEGQRYAWFTLDEALALPELAAYAGNDLRVFQEHLAKQRDARA